MPSYFTHWQAGEPNDSDGIEDCASFTTSGRWNDLNCLTLQGYVCESGPDLCTASAWKTQPGECGCTTPDIDSDQDGVSNCLDSCPDDDDAATLGDCGCPSSPKPVGAACSDGLCIANTRCDGRGTCGSLQECTVNANCSYNARGDTAYVSCHDLKTMQQARDQCLALGMDLLVIESKAEDDYLSIEGSPGRVHWLGAQCESSGAWRWVANGDLFWTPNDVVNGQYNNWLPAQPSQSPGDCAVRDDVSNKWTTAPCTGLGAYICELRDRCPMDPIKRLPGVCGCGRADVDVDGNGVMDCNALTTLNDEPNVDPCLLTIGARPQVDTSLAAASFMAKSMDFATYWALAIDRSDKLDLIFTDLALCKAIRAGDSDGDLVPDSTDQCPYTPPLTPTDDAGCTDPFRAEDVPSDQDVRNAVNEIQIAAAKPGTCDTTASNIPPEVIYGITNNAQLQPAAATIFFNFVPRNCVVRLRIEALTTDPNGWPHGGARTMYFETGTNELGGTVGAGRPLPGVKSLTLTHPNFGVAYENLWSEMKDSSGNTASGPSPYQIFVRAMAVYADGAQSPWSDLVEVRTTGDRQGRRRRQCQEPVSAGSSWRLACLRSLYRGLPMCT